jgi:putative heme transporter
MSSHTEPCTQAGHTPNRLPACGPASAADTVNSQRSRAHIPHHGFIVGWFKQHRAARPARPVAIGVILAGCAVALYAERTTIADGVSVFRHAALSWVAVGIGAECVSMAAFALLQRQLLGAGDSRLTVGTLLAISYTGNAITGAVPVVGSGLALAYTQRQFRARGADAARVSLALAVAGVISAVAFAMIVAVGAILTGNPAAAAFGLVTAAASAAAVACFVIIVRSPRGRAQLQPVLRAALRLGQRTVRRPSGDTAQLSAAVLQRLSSVRLSTSAIALSFAWALVNWGADALCLAAAFAAAGVAVPWSRLLVAWSAGSAAGSFSPTPFGLGIVDVALIAALHGAGLHIGDAVGSVLIYRLITFKIVLTLIWAIRQYLRDRAPQPRGAAGIRRARPG